MLSALSLSGALLGMGEHHAGMCPLVQLHLAVPADDVKMGVIATTCAL